MTHQPHRTDVLVVGTGLSELAAAYDFARVGLRVTIIRERDRTGVVPRGPQADPSGALGEWIETVGAPLRENTSLACRPVNIERGREWVLRGDDWVRLPSPGVFGIPSSPLASEVSEALGTRAALRAYLDRLMPVLTIGKTRYVDALVTKRLGRKVLETFVEPLVRHLYGLPSSEVEVAALAPGLNEAETRAGSLSGAALAYQDRFGALAWGTMPDIGWDAFTRVLEDRLQSYGAQWIDATEPVSARPIDDEHGARWRTGSGSESWEAAILVRGGRTSGEDARRVEVTIDHGRPAWWEQDRNQAGFARVTSGIPGFPGWTRRTTMVDANHGFTELRSPLGVESCAVPEGLTAAAGFDAEPGVDTPAASVVMRRGIPARATVEDQDTECASRSLPLEVDTTQELSERGLERAIVATRERAKMARRAALGLA